MRPTGRGDRIDYAGAIPHNSAPGLAAVERRVAAPQGADVLNFNKVAWRAN
jgi:hypothetical protein